MLPGQNHVYMFALSKSLKYMAKPFVINNESLVNAMGFVVMNAGGKLERFRSNPVMLYGHDHNKLIGRWKDVRVEGSELIADPEFDTDDQSKLYEGKVDRDMLKGCSMGIIMNAAELKDVPGVGLVAAVTDWELMEVSLAAVPANAGAVRLYTEKGILLSAGEIKLSIDNLINKNSETKMEKIQLSAEALQVLGLNSQADAAAISAAVVDLSTKKNAAEKKLNDAAELQASELVDQAIKEGRITADKKENFVKMAKTDYKQAKDIIAAIPAKQSFSSKTRTSGPQSAPQGREDWTLLKWMKDDPKGLKKMQADDPEAYQALRAKYE